MTLSPWSAGELSYQTTGGFCSAAVASWARDWANAGIAAALIASATAKCGNGFMGKLLMNESANDTATGRLRLPPGDQILHAIAANQRTLSDLYQG
jgi:hypothetical protein